MISLNFTSEHLPATNEKISYISLQTFFFKKDFILHFYDLDIWSHQAIS